MPPWMLGSCRDSEIIVASLCLKPKSWNPNLMQLRKKWQLPLMCLGQMAASHLQVSRISYNAAMNSMGISRSWQAALNLAKKHHAGSMDTPALTTAISIRSKISAWQEAVSHFWASQCPSDSLVAGSYNASRLCLSTATRSHAKLQSR